MNFQIKKVKFLLIVVIVNIFSILGFFTIAVALENVAKPGDVKYGSIQSDDFVTPVNSKDTWWFNQLSDSEKSEILSVQCGDWETVYHNYVISKEGKISVMGYCCSPLKESDILDCHVNKPCIGKIRNFKVRKVQGKPVYPKPPICKYRGPVVCDTKLKSLGYKQKSILNQMLGWLLIFKEEQLAATAKSDSTPCFVRDNSSGNQSYPQNPTTPNTPTPQTSQKPTNPAYGDMSSGSGSYDYDKLRNTNGNAGAADTGSGNNTSYSGTFSQTGGTGANTDTGSTEQRINHNIDPSLIKRTPTSDRFAWAYKKDQEYTSNPNPSPDLHPKGYVQDDKYIVPIMRQYMETVESSFKGRPTAFDDLIQSSDEFRQAQREEEEKSFSKLFFDTLARALAGDSNAKAEFRLLTSNKKSNFKTQSSNLNFKNPESYNYKYNDNPSEEIDYKEDILEIENEIALGIAQGALQKATQEALIVKNTASCKEDETASRCMLSKIDKAQRVQREVYIQEISQSPLSSSTKQYLLDIYDGKASPDQNIPLLDEITRYKQWTLDRQSQGIPSKELQARLGAQTQTTQESKQESLLDKAQKSLQSVFDAVLGWFRQ